VPCASASEKKPDQSGRSLGGDAANAPDASTMDNAQAIKGRRFMVHDYIERTIHDQRGH
jgi:hypothetical protein